MAGARTCLGHIQIEAIIGPEWRVATLLGLQFLIFRHIFLVMNVAPSIILKQTMRLRQRCMILVAHVNILLADPILLVVSVEGAELRQVHIDAQANQERLIIDRRLEALSLFEGATGPRRDLLIQLPELTQVKRIQQRFHPDRMLKHIFLKEWSEAWARYVFDKRHNGLLGRASRRQRRIPLMPWLQPRHLVCREVSAIPGCRPPVELLLQRLFVDSWLTRGARGASTHINNTLCELKVIIK